MLRNYVFLSLFFLTLNSCEKIGNKGDFLVVYKTRQDYSRNIYVRVNDDRTKVTVFPSVSDCDTIKIPVKLAKGYYLGTGRNGENGVKSSVTSLTVETYKTYISPDSLLKLVIDFDPFLEYYECEDSKIDWFHNDNGIDTAKLNKVINDNELDKYFDRLK